MVEEIVKDIQCAEQQAADIVAQARIKAREIIHQGTLDAKAQSDVILAEAKNKARALTQAAQQSSQQQAQQKVEKESLTIAESAEKARQNMDAAVALILERVV